MPYKSKAQERFIKGVAHGMKPKKGNMSKQDAKRFMSHSEPKSGNMAALKKAEFSRRKMYG